MKKSFSEIIAEINQTPDDEKTAEQIRKTMLRVAWLCQHKPWVKGTYAGLTQAYWRKFCGIKVNAETFEKLVHAPSPETIGRAFRKLAEKARGTEHEKDFTPSMKTARKRKAREAAMRDLMPKL